MLGSFETIVSALRGWAMAIPSGYIVIAIGLLSLLIFRAQLRKLLSAATSQVKNASLLEHTGWITVGLTLLSILAITLFPFWWSAKTEENAFRETIVKVCGGLLAVLGILLTVVKLRQNAEDLLLKEKTELTSNYLRCIELLGSVRDKDKDSREPTLEARLGAIYALRELTNNPRAPLAPIIEVLCGYVRLNGPAKEVTDSIRLDVQAALDVATQTRPGRPVLDLQDANLAEASLTSADLSDSRIRNASFSGAKLERANFSRAKGVGCLFPSCQLKGASFVDADLVKAEFKKAELYGTDFGGASLEEADLSTAKFDSSTSFDRADLSRTKFFDPLSEELDRTEVQRGLDPTTVRKGKFWESATFSSEFRLKMSEHLSINPPEPPEFNDKTEEGTPASTSVASPVEPDAELVLKTGGIETN